jgi:hypothetical protein
MTDFLGLFPGGKPSGIQEGWLEHTRQRIEDEMYEADRGERAGGGGPIERLATLKEHVYVCVMDEVNGKARSWFDEKHQQIRKMVSDYCELAMNSK